MKDWSTIRADYLQTGDSLRLLAKRYRVSFHSLAKVCKREDWPLARRMAQKEATTTATTGQEVATTALPLPQRSNALRVALVGELERDVQAVQKHAPDTLEIAQQRQTVLRDVANTAKATLNWGDSNPAPLVRIAVLASARFSTPAESLEASPTSIEIETTATKDKL